MSLFCLVILFIVLTGNTLRVAPVKLHISISTVKIKTSYDVDRRRLTLTTPNILLFMENIGVRENLGGLKAANPLGRGHFLKAGDGTFGGIMEG